MFFEEKIKKSPYLSHFRKSTLKVGDYKNEIFGKHNMNHI